MASRVSFASMLSRTSYLTYVGLLAVGLTVLASVSIIPIGIVSYRQVKSNSYSPPIYFSANQTVAQVAALVIDPNGYIKNITAGAVVETNTTTYMAGGEAVEIDTVGGDTEVRLRARSITAGEYRAATATLTAEGVVTAIADGLPIASADVEGDAGPIDVSLDAEFVTSAAAATLANERVLSYSAQDFAVNTSTPGLYAVSLLPSPVAGQACTHPVLIAFGDGVRVNACVSGPAPGTPGGAVPLNGGGVVPMTYIPDVIESRYRGLWDANANTPALSNATCDSNDLFYYTVSTNGSTNLGGITTWVSRDLAVCLNGTWTRVGCMSTGVVSFNARVGAVVPESGDYTPALIPVNGGTLADVLAAPFVTTALSPVLSNEDILTEFESEIEVVGATVGLGDKLPFAPLGVNTTGFVSTLEVSVKGLVDFIDTVPSVVASLAGTPNQVLVSGAPNVTLALPQNYGTSDNVTFASVSIGARTITAGAGGPVNVPNVGAANFVLDVGAQTLAGSKTLTAQPVVRSGQGVRLNNLVNTASVTVKPANDTVGNIAFRHAPSVGASGTIVRTDGAGNLIYGAGPTSAGWVSFVPQVLATTNVASYSFQYAFYQTTGNFVEVMLSVQISRSVGNADTSISINAPDGLPDNFGTPVARGIVSESTIGAQWHGYVENAPSIIGIIVRGTSQTKSGYWFAAFDYVK